MSTWKDYFKDPKPLPKDEALALVKGINISSGGGTIYADHDAANTQLCIMQTVNVYHALVSGKVIDGQTYYWTEGFLHDDEGTGVSWRNVDEVDPVIETAMVTINDKIGRNEWRQKLLAIVPDMLDTKIDDATTKRTRVIRDKVRQVTGEAYDAWVETAGPDPRLQDDSVRERCNKAHPLFAELGSNGDDGIYHLSQYDYETCAYVYKLRTRDEFQESVMENADAMTGSWVRVVFAAFGDGQDMTEDSVDEVIEYMRSLIDIQSKEAVA